MLVQSASVQIPNQGGCESEQNGWGQSFCSEMFSLHSCSGKGVDMWLLKKSWKVMHNWPHTTPNKDSNFPIYLEADDSDGSHTNLCRSYFKTKKVNLAEVEAATECYFSQKLLLVDPDLLLLGKKNSYFSWGNTLKLLSMLCFPVTRQNNPRQEDPFLTN